MNLINLKGFAIGNGLTNPAPQYAQYGRFSYDNKLITESQFEGIQSRTARCVKLLDQGDHGAITNEVCQMIVQSILQDAGNINVYDITKECTYPPLCYDFSAVTTLLGEDSVRDSLGVPTSVQTWESCNMQVHSMFTEDWWSNLEVNIPTMLDEGGLRVLVYSGTNDFIVNWYGGRAWVGNMTWSGQDAYNAQSWNDWKTSGGDVAGTFKSQGNLTFLGVYGAGHMVPMDQGANSVEMLHNFLHGDPFTVKDLKKQRTIQ